MILLGYRLQNQKIVDDFQGGVVSALGGIVVYGIVIACIYAWYRVSCYRHGTCAKSLVKNLSSSTSSAPILAASQQDTRTRRAGPENSGTGTGTSPWTSTSDGGSWE